MTEISKVKILYSPIELVTIYGHYLLLIHVLRSVKAQDIPYKDRYYFLQLMFRAGSVFQLYELNIKSNSIPKGSDGGVLHVVLPAFGIWVTNPTVGWKQNQLTELDLF